MDDDQDDLFRHVNPNWGYSLDLDRAMGAVRIHEEKTGTRYDVLRQDPHFGASLWNSEDCRIQWEENEKHVGERLVFDGVPFIILGSKHLGCQYGVPNPGKNNKYTEWKQEQDEPSQPRRGQCPAKVVLREVIKFPDYRIDNNNSYEKKKFSKMLRDDLTLGAARLQRRIYVELPTAEAHVHTVLVKKVNEASMAHTNAPHCLVCNAKLSASARSAVPLFSGEARTSHRQLELHSVLGSILEEDMQESCLHSSILCSRCYNLIDDIDSLEEQLINKKQVIANRYKRTMAEINKVSGSSEGDYLMDDEEEEDDFDDVPYGKYRSSRGRGRGRPPGRSRGRGPGRPRGRPKINTPKKSPTKCIVKLEYDPERVEDLENVTFFPPIKSPPLKTIKKEDIMHGLETPDNPLQKIENEEGGHIDEKVLHANVSGADMPIVEGDVTMDIQGDVLNVVEEVLEEEVKRGKMFACSECDKQFLTKAAVRNHIKVHNHLDSYDCEECEKSFATKYRLKAHLKTHIDRDRPHNCRVCNKAFYTRYHLSTHMKSHEGLRNFVCELCGKALSTQKTLELHALTHTGEKPYQCEICGSTFRQRSNLHTHIKATHYQEKNYHCQLCQKSFVRKRLLVYHMNSVHTGERPYKCELCNASFVYPHYYKRHLRKHTGVKPHKCHICNKAFASRENRNAHMFTHSDKKPYECKICGSGFMRKPLCASHVTAHGHTENVEAYIIFNSPSLLVSAGQEEMVVADEEEAARAVHAVRMAEEANTHETIEEPVQIMRDGKVVKVMSRPVHIIEADDTTRYVIHTTDRGRDENMEHFFAALQGQVVEVRSEDF
ncbi:zinc finger and BTB domain-containing protein 17-like isoform X1 [Penaeus chinensis]|uniref:zinc finger and BTB domain-containing protein 17-like isoform X1 n=2 Tax=Penaeus chinensis TaxID=139456 RepID=UPI001FB61775|nr:zinc finger and BTB domain-containing protein 17-like isoform X1 [Penaeus chinensis]